MIHQFIHWFRNVHLWESYFNNWFYPGENIFRKKISKKSSNFMNFVWYVYYEFLWIPCVFFIKIHCNFSVKTFLLYFIENYETSKFFRKPYKLLWNFVVFFSKIISCNIISFWKIFNCLYFIFRSRFFLSIEKVQLHY